jgi:hypothetical protein
MAQHAPVGMTEARRRMRTIDKPRAVQERSTKDKGLSNQERVKAEKSDLPSRSLSPCFVLWTSALALGNHEVLVPSCSSW